jgi:hypothetical protein
MWARVRKMIRKEMVLESALLLEDDWCVKMKDDPLINSSVGRRVSEAGIPGELRTLI